MIRKDRSPQEKRRVAQQVAGLLGVRVFKRQANQEKTDEPILVGALFFIEKPGILPVIEHLHLFWLRRQPVERLGRVRQSPGSSVVARNNFDMPARRLMFVESRGVARSE